jgi:site-specific DNA-methyltransferase (adenine-specific)
MIVEQMLKNAQTPLLHIADVSGSALFQGDCLDIMPLIPDKSVQLILADLPYGTTACKWDSIIDLDLLWKQYKRIIKDNGVIALTATQPFASKLINNDLKMFKQEIIWDKIMPVGHLIAGKRIMSVHENILLFWNKQPIFNRQFTERKVEDRRKNIVNNYNNLFTTSKTELVKNTPETRFAKGYDNTKVNPKSIISITKRMAHKDRTHPTQKPLELMKYIIQTYSNENDMVLDNTMGSGTTCLAAKELNRNFIGIEKEANYYEIACRRCGF